MGSDVGMTAKAESEPTEGNLQVLIRIILWMADDLELHESRVTARGVSSPEFAA